MTIGCWGNITWEVSDDKIKTINNVKWESSATYASHDRHLKDPLLEFTGLPNDTISLSMKFSTACGVNPIEEIVKILDAERAAEAHYLIIGPKAYGKNKWVITKSSKALQRFNNYGELLEASVDVTFQAYTER